METLGYALGGWQHRERITGPMALPAATVSRVGGLAYRF